MRTGLDDLKPGMRSPDLLEMDGRLLLPAGTELTSRHLWALAGFPARSADAPGETS